MHRFFIFISLSLFLVFCHSKKETVQPDPSSSPCKEIASGSLSIGTKDSVSLQQVWDLLKQNNASNFQINNCYYLSSWPQDSAVSLLAELNKKPYINYLIYGPLTPEYNVYEDSTNGKMGVHFTLYAMDSTNQKDWILTAQTLKLTEQLHAKSFTMSVPDGKEGYYQDLFSKNPKIDYSKFVCLEDLQPM